MKKFLLILAISLVATFGFTQTVEQQLEDTTEALIELTEDYSFLFDEYTLLLEQLEETTEALESTTLVLKNTTDEFTNNQLVLIDTNKEVLVSQEEIIGLRKELEATVVSSESILQLGLGYTYPNGAEIMLNVNIPKFPIGIYGRANIQFDNTFVLGIGLTIDL